MKTTNKVYLFDTSVKGEAKFASPRLLARALSAFFAETGQETEEVRKTPLGKPYFPSGNFHLSVTHTKNRYLLAVASFPIGLDAEQEGEERPRVAARFFTEEEKGMPFSQVWTAKEAVSKLLGKGLSAVGKICVKNGKAFYEERAFSLVSFVKDGLRVTLCTEEGEEYAVQTLSEK